MAKTQGLVFQRGLFLFIFAFGLFFGDETAEAEQGVGVGFVAAEAHEEHRRVFGVTAFEDILLEGSGGLGVYPRFFYLYRRRQRSTFEEDFIRQTNRRRKITETITASRIAAKKRRVDL